MQKNLWSKTNIEDCRQQNSRAKCEKFQKMECKFVHKLAVILNWVCSYERTSFKFKSLQVYSKIAIINEKKTLSVPNRIFSGIKTKT